jgi:hypothetical protein
MSVRQGRFFPDGNADLRILLSMNKCQTRSDTPKGLPCVRMWLANYELLFAYLAGGATALVAPQKYIYLVIATSKWNVRQ